MDKEKRQERLLGLMVYAITAVSLVGTVGILVWDIYTGNYSPPFV